MQIIHQLSYWMPYVVLVFITYQCTPVEELFDKKTPRETYIHAIQKTSVAKTHIWNEWMMTGDSALHRPVQVSIPFQQKILYFPDDPDAWAWQMQVRKGRKVVFRCVSVDSSHQLFADIYVITSQDTALLYSTSDSMVNYVPDRDEIILFRVQPELLIAGSATISISDEPLLGFPVDGGRINDIGSFWGDPRDGGRRLHKGIDIFAPRGTPAIAAENGRVRRIGNGGLGGKTVWLRTEAGSLYYAHLDSIDVRFGQSVSKGDTIGFVGNTGNARTTPPHLHFGVYDHGAIDPMPFVNAPRYPFHEGELPVSEKNKWGRIHASSANVRPLPSTEQKFITSLKHNDLVRLRGMVNDWYHVELSGDHSGFIHSSLVETDISPLDEIEVQPNQPLYLDNIDRIIMAYVGESLTLQNFGSFGPYTLTRYKNRWMTILGQQED